MISKMIDKEEALKFLEAYQPLPSDSELSKNINILNIYNEVRKYFLTHYDPRCIPLFLNSFGGRNGFGVYQLIEDVLKCYPSELVIPFIKLALHSKFESVIYWNAQIAVSFPDDSLQESLINLINHHNVDIRYTAISALSRMPNQDYKEYLKTRLIFESDNDIIELIHELL